MANYKYSAKDSENAAKAVGRSLSISTKQSIEICNFIRKKQVQKAKMMLNDVIEKKIAVPFKRFTAVGHKPGKIASGRYPEKSAKEILKVLESAEKNAQFKGLNTSNLIISHTCAHKASRPWHYGRQRRIKMKRTHIEIIVEESAKSDSKKERIKPNIKTEQMQKIDNKKTEKKKNKQKLEEK